MPSRDIGEPRFELLEDHVADHEPDRRRERARDEERQVGGSVVEERAAETLDHRGERIEDRIDRPDTVAG